MRERERERERDGKTEEGVEREGWRERNLAIFRRFFDFEIKA